MRKTKEQAIEMFRGISRQDLKDILGVNEVVEFPDDYLKVIYTEKKGKGELHMLSKPVAELGNKRLLVELSFTKEGRLEGVEPRTAASSSKKKPNDPAFELGQEIRKSFAGERIDKISETKPGFVIRDDKNKICGVGIVKKGKILVSMNDVVGTLNYGTLSGKYDPTTIKVKPANDIENKKTEKSNNMVKK